MDRFLSTRSPQRQKLNIDEFVKPITARKPIVFGKDNSNYDISKMSLNKVTSKSKLNTSNITTQTKKRKDISGIIKSIKNENPKK